MDRNNDRPAQIPLSRDNAALIATLYHRLGGSLHINEKAERCQIQPCRGLYAGSGAARIPQLPGAESHEIFRSGEEWDGAMKLVSYLLDRLGPDDRNFVYDAFAAVETSREFGR